MSVATISASIKLELGQFKASVAAAKQEMDGLKQKTQQTAQDTEDSTSQGSRGFKKWGSDVVGVAAGVKAIGSDLTKHVTVPIVGIGAAAAKTGITFGQKMAEVQAISGASGKDLKDLENKAREMGATTKFSASDAGDAMKYMAMAGWKTGDMMSGISGIMDLAAASGEDLGTTSDIVTDALTAFGMQAGQSGELADVLAAASNNANTNVSLLGESFKYVAPVAGAMGYSAKDTATALGLMANAGIKGSMSGTALKTMITNLVNPTKQMKDQMDQLGISMTNQDGSAKNLKQVMDELRSKFSGLSEEQKASAAATIFGKEAMSGALAIINSAPSDYEKLTKAMDKSDGTAKKMADTMNKTTQGDIYELQSALEECALELYDAFAPSLQKVIIKITDMAKSFQKLSPEQKKNIVKWAGIIAAIGPVLKIFANVVLSIKKIYDAFKLIRKGALLVKEGFKLLGAAAAPELLPIIAVVAAVGFAAYELWKHWDEVCKFCSGAWKSLKSLASDVFGGIKDKVTNFTSETASKVKEKWGQIKQDTSQKWSEIKDAASGKAGEIKSAISEKWSGIKESSSETWAGVSQGVSDGLSTTKSVVAETASSVRDAAVSKFTELKNNSIIIFTTLEEAAKPIFDGFKNIISVPFSLAWTLLQGILLTIQAGLEITWAAIQQGTQVAWGLVKQYIVTPITETFTAVSDKATQMKDATVGKFTEIAGKAGEKWAEIKGAITGKFNEAKARAAEIGGQLKDSVSEKFNQVKESTKQKWQQVKDAISTKFNAAKTKASEIASNIHQTLSGKFQQIKDVTSQKWQSVKDAVSTKMGQAKQAASSKAAEMHSAVSSKFGEIASVAGSKFNAAKDAIINPLNAAKNKVKSILGSIKSWFSNLHLKIPSPHMPPMPHFSLRTSTKSVFGKAITYPSGINVNWYATGGIATGASVVGVGEAGDEAIIPLSNKGRMKPFAQAVSSMINKDGSGTGGNGSVNDPDPIVITGNTLIIREDADIERVAKKLYELQQREKRALGKGDK